MQADIKLYVSESVVSRRKRLIHCLLSAVFDHLDFQDRTILIWEKIAEHYRDNEMVAGYNPLNEPTDSKQTRLVQFYDRVERAIRAIDPHHILFLE
jgi:hypothetical protein